MSQVILKVAIGCIAFVQLTACSKTVEWEEEVPLNTGEVIWVKRSGSYKHESEAGNPLRFAYRPQWRSTIEFKYRGSRYSHTDEAGLVLLAISPEGTPNIVAMAAEFDWHVKNQYPCVVPYYVQFKPDSSGSRWDWPDQIESWLYGLPTNLIFGIAPLDAQGKKFTAAERNRENASLLAAGSQYQTISPRFAHRRCFRRS